MLSRPFKGVAHRRFQSSLQIHQWDFHCRTFGGGFFPKCMHIGFFHTGMHGTDLDKISAHLLGLLRSFNLASFETTFWKPGGNLDDWTSIQRWKLCKCCDHNRINIENTHLNLESHVEQRGKRIRRLQSRCCAWTKRESPCATEECALCTELKFMEIHSTVTSALLALIACTKASVDMQHFRQRRAEASKTWCEQQASSTSPADELGKVFETDGSFPIFGPLIAISITPLLHSDFGPCPAIRGCWLPDSVSETGGWDSN